MRSRSQSNREDTAGGSAMLSFPGPRIWLLWLSIIAILFVFGCSSAAWTQSADAIGISGGNHSAAVRARIANPLVVQATGANYDPVPEVTVTFNVPASGASASLSSTTGTTVSEGTASVTATANGIASSRQYRVRAAASVSTPGTFSFAGPPGAGSSRSCAPQRSRDSTSPRLR